MTDFGLSALVNAHLKQRKLTTKPSVSSEDDLQKAREEKSNAMAEGWTENAKAHIAGMRSAKGGGRAGPRSGKKFKVAGEKS